jgi:hypothetical protein
MIKGCLLGLSYVSTAAILSPPGVPEVLMLSMWRTVFVRGFHLCPSLAIFSGLICFVNAYLSHRHEANSVSLGQDSSRVYLLLVAGAFMIGIVPFTLYMIVPTEEIMLKKEAKLDDGINGKAGTSGSEGSAAETRRLLKRWATLNYGRAILPMVGVLVAWSVW